MQKNKLILIVFLLSTISGWGEQTTVYTDPIQSVSIDSDSQTDSSPFTLTTYLKSDTQSQKITVSSKEISSQHITTPAQLFSAAGIQFTSTGTDTSPVVHGFSGTSVKVYIDDILQNSSQSGTFDFSTINFSTIDHVSIIKSAFDSTDSSNPSSGISIFFYTKKTVLGRQLTVDVSALTYGTNKGIDSYFVNSQYQQQLTENTFLSLFASADTAQNDFGFISQSSYYNGEYRDHPNSEAKGFSGTMNMIHYFNEGDSLQLSNRMYYSDQNIAGSEYNYESGDYDVLKNLDNTFSAAVKIVSLADFIITSSTAFNLNHETYNQKLYETTDSGSDSTHFVSYINATSSVKYLGSRFTPVLSYSFRYSYINSTDTGIHAAPDGFIKFSATIPLGLHFDVLTPESVAFSGESFIPVPRIGFKLKTNLSDIQLNLFRVYNFPTFNQLYWTGYGNSSLLPETGWSSELTINSKVSWLPLSISGYATYYQNKIVSVIRLNGTYTVENASSILYAGFDLSSKVSIRDNYTFSASYAFTYTDFLESASSLSNGSQLPYVPMHTFSLSSELRFSPVTLTVDYSFTGTRYTTSTNGYYLPAYSIINLSLDLTCSRFVSIYSRIDNLLNTQYYLVNLYPMPGISVRAGIKISL